MPIFMKMEGVSGDVTYKGYEGWIPVDAVSWGLETTGPRFRDMTVIIDQAKGSPKMFLACATGKPLTLVNIAFVDDSSLEFGPYEAYRYNLKGVVVSSYNMSQSLEDIAPTPIELTLTFSYIYYQIKYRDFKGAIVTQSAEYDLTVAR